MFIRRKQTIRHCIIVFHICTKSVTIVFLLLLTSLLFSFVFIFMEWFTKRRFPLSNNVHSMITNATDIMEDRPGTQDVRWEAFVDVE